MAAKEKEIKVKISAKDEASRELEKAMGKVKDVAKVAFTAVAGAIALSVNAASQFEKGMSNVYTLVDRNKEAFHDMENDIKYIATEVPVAMGELVEGLYDVRSAGIDSAQAMGVLQKSAMLGVAGLGTTKEAVNIATSAINAFGLSGKEADKAFNTIFLTVKNGKTNISELSQSFGMVAGIAATLGIEFEELQAATAALTTTGQKASVAQTQLKAAMLAISAPTTGMIELLKKAGIADGAAALAKEGLVSVMGKLDKASEGNMNTLKGAYGSVEALGAAVSLTGKQAGAFEAALNSMNGSGEITEDVMKELTEAFELQKETFDAQAQILKNQLNIALIDLGSVIMPILIEKMQKIGTVLKSVMEWWLDIDYETKKFITTILGAIGSFVSTAAALVGISVAVSKVSTAVKALNLVLKANPIMFVIGLIISLGVALYNLYQTNEDFRNKLNAIWSGIKNTVSAAVNGVVAAFNWTKNKIVEILSSIKETTVSVGNGIADGFNAFKNKVVSIFQAAWKAITDVAMGGVNAVKGVFNWFNANIVPIFVGAWGRVVEVATEAFNFIKKKLQEFNDFMRPIWDALWRFYQAALEPAVKFMINKFSEMFATVKAGLTIFAEVVTAIWSPLWEGIKAIASVVWEFLKVGFGLLWEVISTAFKIYATIVIGIWTGLWEAVKVVASTVWEVIKAGAKLFWDFLTASFTTTAGVVGAVWSGLWEGIKAVASTVWEVIKAVISGAWAGIEATFNAYKSVLTTVWGGVWDGIVVSVTTARDTIVKIIDTITNAITAIPRAVSGAVEGVKSVGSSILNAPSQAGNAFGGWIKSKLGFANGGRMSAGESRIIGEHGAERFMPDVSGTVEPNKDIGGGGLVINITGNQFLDRNGAEQVLELAFEKFKLTNKFSS